MKVLRQAGGKYWKMARDHASREIMPRDDAVIVVRSQIKYGLIDHIKDFGFDLRISRNHWKYFN